jgi:hypothetical protein
MDTIPNSILQHLSGFLPKNDNKNLSCTAKRFRDKIEQVRFSFVVWRVAKRRLGLIGFAGCCEAPTVWSIEAKNELMKRLTADPKVVKIKVRRGGDEKQYRRKGFVDRIIVEDMELFRRHGVVSDYLVRWEKMELF